MTFVVLVTTFIYTTFVVLAFLMHFFLYFLLYNLVQQAYVDDGPLDNLPRSPLDDNMTFVVLSTIFIYTTFVVLAILMHFFLYFLLYDLVQPPTYIDDGPLNNLP
jgi:hypothetical protein